MIVTEIHLFDNVYFENKFLKDQVLILRAFTNSYTGELRNEGNIVVEYGNLFALHNLHDFRSEKLTVSHLKQEGEMKCANLVIEQDGVNSGTLGVDKLSGKGVFYQSKILETKKSSKIDIYICSFILRGPQNITKEVVFCGNYLEIDKNCEF